ncbi:MAG: ATP-dependent DNA helicase UvrD2 [Actinobacteria bacterium]|nr:ATP-dependent DNA helicase UvrD2 [Actinomycetota bacterium]
MHTSTVLDKAIARGLNEQQCQALSILRGPVCILAGAGSGKTTTITRRIANQVRTGTFLPSEILAVTFTDKAAKEMVSRLRTLSVQEVRARTFHSEALSQYRRFTTEPFEILGSKGAILASLVQSLPMPYRFTSLRDIATEIEWAKNQRIRPSQYEARLGDHEGPIPEDLMTRVFASYEKRKQASRQIDFEDLLENTISIFESNLSALSEVRESYRSFTVDEYQDVNVLQQTLLDLWLGERDDLCVVGDDYQSIFSFTGASARYLLDFPKRFPACNVITLTTNYRSTPEILSVANRLAPLLEGKPKILRPAVPAGPSPTISRFTLAEEEVDFIVRKTKELRHDGTGWSQIAVLYRINGRSEELESAFAKAKIPFQVKDSVFLRRPAARSILARLRRSSKLPAASTVHELANELGYEPDSDHSGDEATRQADLARFIALASGAEGDIASFIKDLEKRFASDESADGVQILTYHRAKGLEFQSVFLPRCEDKELPFALSKTPQQIAEERRLFYVGITRAKRDLFITWVTLRSNERKKAQSASVFLQEIGWVDRAANGATGSAGSSGPAATAVQGTKKPRVVESVDARDKALFEALRNWRLDKSKQEAVPAYVVFHDRTLAQIVSVRPKDAGALAAIPGIGSTKCARYADEVLKIVARA